MTYAELLTRLARQGYTIVSTGGMTETIEQHLADLGGDYANVIHGESEDPNDPCLLIYVLPDQKHPICKVCRTPDYAHYCEVVDWDVESELRRLGLQGE